MPDLPCICALVWPAVCSPPAHVLPSPSPPHPSPLAGRHAEVPGGGVRGARAAAWQGHAQRARRRGRRRRGRAARAAGGGHGGPGATGIGGWGAGGWGAGGGKGETEGEAGRGKHARCRIQGSCGCTRRIPAAVTSADSECRSPHLLIVFSTAFFPRSPCLPRILRPPAPSPGPRSSPRRRRSCPRSSRTPTPPRACSCTWRGAAAA
jgi:hypothetical protein